MIVRGHHTIKYVGDSNAVSERSGNFSFWKLFHKQMREKAPLANSKEIIFKTGASSVSRSTRCRILCHFAKCIKPDIWPPLKTSTCWQEDKRVCDESGLSDKVTMPPDFSCLKRINYGMLFQHNQEVSGSKTHLSHIWPR